MKVFVCPMCGSVYKTDDAEKKCGDCNVNAINTQLLDSDWNSKSKEEKQIIVNEIKSISVKDKVKTEQKNSQNAFQLGGKGMRTVEEMIEMAKNYPTTHGGLLSQNLERLPFDKIVTSLASDEEVVLAFGAAAAVVGKTAYQIVAAAFTNKRLLVAGRPNSVIGSFMASGVKSIKLDKFNSIGAFGMNIRLDSIGDEDVVFGSYSAEVREKLSNDIQIIIDNYESDHASNTSRNITNVVQKSPAEQIKEFKELLDSGIITQDEFNEKKKQLLGL